MVVQIIEKIVMIVQLIILKLKEKKIIAIFQKKFIIYLMKNILKKVMSINLVMKIVLPAGVQQQIALNAKKDLISLLMNKIFLRLASNKVNL